jgi:hypothetical protein
MFTNLYSKENISEIFDLSNKRAQLKKEWFNLEKDSFIFEENHKEIVALRDEIKKMNRDIKEQNKELIKLNNASKKEEDFEKIRKLKEKIRGVDDDKENKIMQIESKIKERSDFLDRLKSNIADEILKHNFSINFIKKPFDEEKDMFVVENINSYFACKILTKELRKAYKAYPSDRTSILNKLNIFLQESTDKLLVRADIKSFFESISQEKLMKKLEDDGIMSHKSLKLFKGAFYNLKNLHKLGDGVPRGVSFSSCLSEIYMKSFDEEFSRLPGIFFYKRYVDDIIILAVPSDNIPNASSLYSHLAKTMHEKLGLCIHDSNENGKSLIKDISYKTKQNFSFTYLGYKIEICTKPMKVAFLLSDKKVDKYKDSINAAFDFYVRWNHTRNKKGGKEPLIVLYKMLQFMTCNYHLSGNKYDIFSGIYFKHRLLSDEQQLVFLDEYLLKKMNESITEEKISNNLFKYLDEDKRRPEKYCAYIRDKIKKNFSFQKGFKERRMCNISSAEFRVIKHRIKVKNDEV